MSELIPPGKQHQAAVNAASPGDTVLIEPGVYHQSDEAGFYVGDSPQADTVVRDDQAYGNQFGIFIRHARHVLVTDNHVSGNCQGILVLDDGQSG